MCLKRYKINLQDYPMSYIDYDEDKFLVNSSSPPFLAEKNLKIKNIENFIKELQKINNNDLTEVLSLEQPERFLKPVYNIQENYQLIVSIKGVGFISVPKLFIEIECSKCKKRQTVASSTECVKCRHNVKLKYLPTYKSSLLGNLELENAKITFFHPQNYLIECSNCSKIFITRKIQAEENKKFKCPQCFAQLLLKIIKIGPKNEHQDIKLSLNTPLPNNGNCKHYKKSFRYFRFKCCNLIFPCDVCHNEKSNHIADDRADRMICGFCSKEQSVRDRCACGHSMKSGYTGFWNAGKGTRNKAVMNKKDSKKYKRTNK